MNKKFDFNQFFVNRVAKIYIIKNYSVKIDMSILGTLQKIIIYTVKTSVFNYSSNEKNILLIFKSFKLVLYIGTL